MSTWDRACEHPSVSPSVKAVSITPHIDTGEIHVTTRKATSSGISIGDEEGGDLEDLGPEDQIHIQFQFITCMSFLEFFRELVTNLSSLLLQLLFYTLSFCLLFTHTNE